MSGDSFDRSKGLLFGRGDRKMNLDNGTSLDNQTQKCPATRTDIFDETSLTAFLLSRGIKIPSCHHRYKGTRKERLELKLRLRPTNFSSGHKFESEEGGKGGFGKDGHMQK